jgi:hypothetical protein
MKKQTHPKNVYETYSVRHAERISHKQDEWRYYEERNIEDAIVEFLKETHPHLPRINYEISPISYTDPDVFRIEIDYGYNYLTKIRLYYSRLSPDNFPLPIYIEAKEGYIKNLTKLDKVLNFFKNIF